LLAEIFPPALTKPTSAVGVAQPGDPHALADLQSTTARSQLIDNPHDLMAGNNRHLHRLKIALDDVKIGPADSAAADAHANLVIAGNRIGNFDSAKW
jgi:hypothetical protein